MTLQRALLLGILIGVGLVVLFDGMRPRPPALAKALRSLHRPTVRFRSSGVGQQSRLTQTLGARLANTGFGKGLSSSSAQDLRVLNRTPEEHMARVAVFALVGFFFAPLATMTLRIVGIKLPFVLPLWLGLGGAAALSASALFGLKSEAENRRRAFRHALSAFLDVVSVSLAAGKGVESSLETAAEAGEGWAFAEIRRALLESRLAGETPWVGLGNLGEELGVNELNELAASTALAGDEGARVRQSLQAKGSSIRQRGMAETQAKAEAATERLALPIVLLLMGFLVFLGYPAMARITGGI